MAASKYRRVEETCHVGRAAFCPEILGETLVGSHVAMFWLLFVTEENLNLLFITAEMVETEATLELRSVFLPAFLNVLIQNKIF